MMTPNELLERLESLQNFMLSRATGGAPDEAEYIAIRKELVSDPTINPLLPRIVLTCRDLSQFWGMIKMKFSSYDERRNYIRCEFAPALTKLESFPSSLSEESLTEYLRNFEQGNQPQLSSGDRAEPTIESNQINIFQRHNSRPIKILFLAANPIDTPSLRLDAEVRAIDQALRKSEFRNRFDIEQHWAVRLSDLQEYLLRHQPDIVHFSGHGNSANEIVLEDETGNSRQVSILALSQLFSILRDNIRCVVLNACYSERQGQAIAEHIDCVVGMSSSIADTASISFASAFYQALGFGRDVKTAFDLGCVQIGFEDLNEQEIPRIIALRTDPKDIIFARSA
ncbi:MAG: CHAT domain-containing protein [Acidobacteria bacterium]|nr:CHAT domain-containing protein [Acidobacteriota bacterium]